MDWVEWRVLHSQPSFQVHMEALEDLFKSLFNLQLWELSLKLYQYDIGKHYHFNDFV